MDKPESIGHIIQALEEEIETRRMVYIDDEPTLTALIWARDYITEIAEVTGQ